MLFIDSENRGQGYGSMLLEFAKQKGATKVDVNEQNPLALAFYQAKGFRVTGRNETDDAERPYPINVMAVGKRSEVIMNTGVEESVDSKIVHNIFDANGNVIGQKEFPTDKMESEGTKKMIEIADPLVDAIRLGKILVYQTPIQHENHSGPENFLTGLPRSRLS